VGKVLRWGAGRHEKGCGEDVKRGRRRGGRGNGYRGGAILGGKIAKGIGQGVGWRGRWGLRMRRGKGGRGGGVGDRGED